MKLTSVPLALTVARRLEEDPQVTDPAQRAAILADWVAAFKAKRAQLVDHVCPR